MKQYNAQLKYVGARPRRDKKLGKGGSAVIAGSATPTGGVSKSYIDSNFVTLATEQAISGRKNFVGGVEVNGQELVYDAEKKVWQLTGDLVVTGAVTMFGSLSGFTPSTVMDAVLVDGTTIVKDEQGRLTVIGGGSGGSGGGLTATEVSLLISNALAPVNDSIATKWTQDDAKISNWNKAYEWGNHALAGYATTSAVSSAISSALTGYATQSWVGDNYLAKSGGVISFNTNSNLTIKTTSGAWSGIKFETLTGGSGYIGVHLNNPVFVPSDLSEIKWILHSGNYTDYFTKANIKSTLGISDWALAATKPSYTAAEVGALSTSGGVISSLTIGRGTNSYETLLLNTSTGVGFLIYEGGVNWKVSDANWSNSYSIIHSGNIGQQSVNYAASAGVADSVSVTPVTESGGYSLALLTSSSTRTQSVCVSNNQMALFNPSTGALTATSFIGNLTGNADSATKLQTARTIWGQSFDGTRNITGDITFNSEQKISWHNSPNYYYISSPPTSDAARLEYNSYGGHTFLGGNVSIGGKTASAKLHVHGTGCVINHFSIGTYLGQFNADRAELSIVSQGDAPTDLMFGYNGTQKWSISSRGAISSFAKGIGLYNYENYSWAWLVDVNNNVAIGGTTASTKLHVHGDILATGAITMFSQLSMKNVMDYDGLSLAQLEQIKPARFTWKDGRDNRIHVGGVADYIQPIIPEVVYETVNKELTVDYGSAAFYIGTSLIKPVVELWEVKDKQQQEIESLKKRVEYLENENRQLRAS